jgi:hypothetical protein
MSTIISANVSDGTLSIPTAFVTNGSAKAWVNFDGTGTIAARDSLNLSSLTDNGVGDYTVNFSNAFGAADYCPHFSIGDIVQRDAVTGGKSNATRLTTSVDVIVANNVQSAAVDTNSVYVSAFGDLA